MATQKSILEDAANIAIEKSAKPKPSRVVEALIEIEKVNKKKKTNYSLEDLIGSWNLRFITGTKKTRKKAGVVLGAGRYIPKLSKIKIIYEQDQESVSNTGRVKNSVKLGFLNLSLTGPIKFIARKNLLVFDFTKMTITTFNFRLYEGYIRDGIKKETEFYAQEIKHQAFFSYFLIDKNLLAARGRGGGLALWSRQLDN